MRGRGSILALVVLLLAVVPAGAQARTKCQRLDAKDDLAPAKKVKLVERPNADGGKDLLGCVLPGGKVRTVAASSDQGTSIDKYKLLQVAGHHVLIRGSSSNQYGSGTVTYVFDVKRGRHYDLAATCENLGNPCAPQTKARRALINSGGQAVALVGTRGSDLVSVDGFSASGTRKVLDTGARGDIPASSLELDGHVASWTNRGAHKSALLPTIPDCERLKAKHDLAPAKGVKLAARKNAEGGKDLVGCVLPDGKVSIVASSTKVSGQQRSYKLLQVAGHAALVRGDLVNPYGHAVATYVFDLKRARSYNLAESCFDEHGAACDQTYARRAFVNGQAQAVALIRTDGTDERQVIGFSSTGKSKVLDTGTAAEIPASSLSLEGHVARWTHSGAPRSATLSG